MRITNKGVARQSPPFTFRFGKRDVTAFPGETLAAALVNADIWTLRMTKGGGGRGLYCGMGVCGECAVLVDGHQRRACLEYARDGAQVEVMPPRAPALAREGGVQAGEDHITPDLLVVGAGPAGLAAARTAARAGLDVVVCDERASAGGQYFKQPGTGFTVHDPSLDRQFREGRILASEAQQFGARILSDASLWGAFAPDDLRLSVAGMALRASPRRVILATGAFERPHIFPGWTLPGVMTTGAAQTLLRASQSTPGKRVLIAGNGPLNLQVARELLSAGAQVVALAELAPPPWRAHWVGTLRMMAASPALAGAGLSHLRALQKAGVDVRYGHMVIRAEGDDKLRRATIARLDPDGTVVADSELQFEVDSLCLGYGFLPQGELARALGCKQGPGDQGDFVFERDADFRTSVPSVFIAGDGGGLGGAPSAQAQGIISAAAVAQDLGFATDQKELRQARRALRRHSAFQKSLWKIYSPVAPLPMLAQPDTLLCRCEEIDRQAIEDAFAPGSLGLRPFKRALRLGMGRCQGRYCSAVVARLLADLGQPALTPDDQFAPRAPLKPVPIADIAKSPDI